MMLNKTNLKRSRGRFATAVWSNAFRAAFETSFTKCICSMAHGTKETGKHFQKYPRKIE